jgi:hypothetical protein
MGSVIQSNTGWVVYAVESKGFTRECNVKWCFVTYGTVIRSADGDRGTFIIIIIIIIIIREAVLFNSTQVLSLLQKSWFETSVPSCW